MKPRLFAFLRAINVGGHTVTMDTLRALFEDLGLNDVKSFIASGNLHFTSPGTSVPALERKIEARLEKALSIRPRPCFAAPPEYLLKK